MLDCEGLELQKDNKESGEGEDCDDGDAEEGFPDEEEKEDLFAGRRNERLSKIIPTLEEIEHGHEQSNLCKAWWHDKKQAGNDRGGEAGQKRRRSPSRLNCKRWH